MTNTETSSEDPTSFVVRVPFAGYIATTVEAADASEAEEKALEAAWDITLELTDPKSVDHWEYEMLSRIVQGNVCYAPLFEIEVADDEF